MKKEGRTGRKNHHSEAIGVLAFKNGTKQGVHIDLLTTSLLTTERLRPQLNVQTVVGNLTPRQNNGASLLQEMHTPQSVGTRRT